MDISNLKEPAYWAKLENDNVHGKIIDIRSWKEKPKELGYLLLRATTITDWDTMDIQCRLLSLNLDTLFLRHGKSKELENQLKKNISDVLKGEYHAPTIPTTTGNIETDYKTLELDSLIQIYGLNNVRDYLTKIHGVPANIGIFKNKDTNQWHYWDSTPKK
jgi:hypothetical protein